VNGVIAHDINPGPFVENIKNQPLSLIIDDEPDICFLLMEILHKKNLHNFSVNNLADAILFLQSHDPAVIFLDNKLSDGSGIDYIRSFKEQHPAVRIVMITAHDNFRKEAINEGADHFITKPFSKDEILEAIAGIVE
jgi:DNA-binding NtrC family response regulator